MTSASSMLQPWTFEKHAQPSVTALLERVNRERGHFRDITTASLQEELVAEGALALSDSEDEPSPAKTDSEPQHDAATTHDDLFRAKHDMLDKISYAHNEVMMALDFVSLLVSKDLPAGRQTMSQFLKENVSAGTLGSDLWKQTSPDPALEAKNLVLAQNIRFEALEKSADQMLAAAKTLESNVKSEIHYWNQVNTITAKGWSVCRLPGPQRKLGVRYGFSESAPRFNKAGLAALEANADGDIIISNSNHKQTKIMRVTIYRDNKPVGRSSLKSDGGSRALEDRIRQARDSLFDEELFYEMERESRTLVSHGVKSHGSTLSVPLGSADNTEARFELLSREGEGLSVTDAVDVDSKVADSTLCAARLLLCRTHRESLKQRSQIPPPLSARVSDRPLANILRPLVAYSNLNNIISQLNDHLRLSGRLLTATGLAVTKQLLNISLPLLSRQSNLHDTVQYMLSPAICRGQLRLAATGQASVLELNIAINMAYLDNPGAVISLQLADQTALDFHTCTEAVVAMDRQVARMVALFLATRDETGWVVDDCTANLSRTTLKAEDGIKRRVACVVVHTSPDSSSLSLLLANDQYQWTSAEAGQESLLDRWRSISS